MELVYITIGIIAAAVFVGILIKLPEWFDEMFNELFNDK